MDVNQAIAQRRSVRRFEDKPIAKELIAKLLHAATLAPSGKNRQPWRFVVLQGTSRDRLVDMMIQGIGHLASQGIPVGSAANSAKVIAQAPVTILIYDPRWKPEDDHNGMQRYQSLVDTQSVGAAIQNMLLAAEDQGLSSLWICDVFVAEPLLATWLQCQDELVAAVSLGYAAESPAARPRKTWEEITQWLE